MIEREPYRLSLYRHIWIRAHPDSEGLAMRRWRILVGKLPIALALMAGGCDPAKTGEPRDYEVLVRAGLDCPKLFHNLRLSTTEGNVCNYASDDGELVTLSYLPLRGRSPTAAIGDVESQLRARLPLANHTDDGRLRNFGDNPHRADDDVEEDAAAHADASAGERANLKHDFDPDGAVVRSAFVGRKAVNLWFLHASNRSGPSGERAVAYCARGPLTGPLVLAVASRRQDKAKWSQEDSADLRELVNRNVRRAPRWPLGLDSKR